MKVLEGNLKNVCQRGHTFITSSGWGEGRAGKNVQNSDANLLHLRGNKNLRLLYGYIVENPEEQGETVSILFNLQTIFNFCGKQHFLYSTEINFFAFIYKLIGLVNGSIPPAGGFWC